MVRPTQEGRSRPLSDAESDSSVTTIVGDDGVDIDGGGGSDPGGGSGVVVAPAAEALVVVADSADDADWPTGTVGEIDFTEANWWDITLTDDLTITILNAPASGTVGRLHVILRQGGAGSFTVTWPAEVEWPDTDGTSGGAAPTLFTAVDARDEVELITEDGGTSYGGTHGEGASVVTGNLPWFNVMDSTYGAVNDGSTDDTTAIDAAIAALNSAGFGVLYFPGGTGYKVTAGLTAITAPCTILGDGGGEQAATVISLDHASDSLFTLSANSIRVSNMKLVNIHGSETAGAAITPTTGHGRHNAYDHLWIEGFRDGLNLSYGWEWTLTDSQITNPVRYGVLVASLDLPDAGDWAIANCWFGTRSRNATSGIRIESAGGGKITNVKINQNSQADQSTYSGVKRFVTGLDLNCQSTTTILLVTNLSVENVSGDAVLIGRTSSATYKFVVIDGLQVGLYSNNSGFAVKITGGISKVILDDIVAKTDGTARAAVSLTSTTDVTLGWIVLEGFNARYTSSGDSGTVDGATPAFATPSIVLGTAAAAGAATTVIRSDSTIVAFDATSPTTQAIGDSAATGSAAVAARRDHKHAMPAFGSVTAQTTAGASSSDGTAVTVSHSDHTHGTPAGGGSGASDHEHIENVVFSGDGSTSVWELPAAPIDSTSIKVFVTGSRSIAWVLSGALLTTLTFDSAPASAANNIVIDIDAAVA